MSKMEIISNINIGSEDIRVEQAYNKILEKIEISLNSLDYVKCNKIELNEIEGIYEDENLSWYEQDYGYFDVTISFDGYERVISFDSNGELI